MLSRKWVSIAIVLSTLMPGVSWASGTGNGVASGLTVEGSSAKLYLSNVPSGGATCATTQRWAVDISTPKGQAMWSTLLLAYSMNKAVSVGGTGACDVWGDSETLARLTIN